MQPTERREMKICKKMMFLMMMFIVASTLLTFVGGALLFWATWVGQRRSAGPAGRFRVGSAEVGRDWSGQDSE